MIVKDGVLTNVSQENLENLISHPSAWRGITSIGEYAFNSQSPFLSFKNASLIIPRGITSIGAHAFENAYSLVKISLPPTIQTIGDRAFACSGLSSITIPSNIKTLERSTFNNCFRLTTVTLPDGLEEIKAYAFANCPKLVNVNMPDSITELGSETFYKCSKLENIHLPANITTIPRMIFEKCYNLKHIDIPKGVTEIGYGAFNYCSQLQTITIPDGVQLIDHNAFHHCHSLTHVSLPKSLKVINNNAFADCKSLTTLEIPCSVEKINFSAFGQISNPDMFTKIYYTNTGNMILTKDTNQNEQAFAKYKTSRPFSYENLDLNFRQNLTSCVNLYNNKLIKFIPPDYILKTFPHAEIKNFFINNNQNRWRKLTTQLHIQLVKDSTQSSGVAMIDSDTSITPHLREIYLTDLLKVYYALGGFSSNQGESERAFAYVSEHILSNAHNNDISTYQYIHNKFARLDIVRSHYSPTFAQFFMKYYHNNHDFMVFDVDNTYDGHTSRQDYLCPSYNNWRSILQNYPYRVVNGNEERALLTPEFVAKHSSDVAYNKVEKDNHELARLLGSYGYTQTQFEEMQEVFDMAKKIKSKFVIKADKAHQSGNVQFRILDKDDPLGFILGDITNCCQVWGGVARSCVEDGYTNPNAGFMVFEESLLDEKGKPTGKTRILGQAYMWYDPETKTVCYDNIEIPSKVLKELFSGEKHKSNISASSLINAINNSAEAIIQEMNKKEIRVTRVTTGSAFNDLTKVLFEKYKTEPHPIAKHRNYNGYTDANSSQFILKDLTMRKDELPINNIDNLDCELISDNER